MSLSKLYSDTIPKSSPGRKPFPILNSFVAFDAVIVEKFIPPCNPNFILLVYPVNGIIRNVRNIIFLILEFTI